MSSSPPPESGVENQVEVSTESGHGKEAEAESGHRKEAEEVILKPVKAEGAAAQGEGSSSISIKVSSQTAPEVLFRVKRNIVMQRIMDQYCGKYSLTLKEVRFLFDGKKIKPTHTAEQAGLEDGSEIDVFLHMDGGSGRSSV